MKSCFIDYGNMTRAIFKHRLATHEAFTGGRNTNGNGKMKGVGK